MSLAYFIAKRIHFSKGDDSLRVSPPTIRIAIAGIAIGLVVMILSVAIVIGFKKEIREKAIGFGGHLQVQALTDNRTFETSPICIDDTLINTVRQVEGIKEIRSYITKPAVLKTTEDFLAIAIKGEDISDSLSFISRNLKEGTTPQTDRDIVISQIIADKLHLKVGDKVRLYFIKADQSANQFEFGADGSSIKARQLSVSGIYATHFNEYDKQMIVGSIEMLQNINGWDEDMASGLEINIEDYDNLEETYYNLIFAITELNDRRGTPYYVQTIEQQNPQIFSWLALLDTNVWVILILMIIVASFTMISGLLIIILERTTMIGVLKALGCPNRELRKVFLYIAAFLIGKGIIIGDIIGLVLCFIQYNYHIISLDPENYYLEWVPISISLWQIIAINIGTIIISLLVLIIPSSLVANISPVKAIQSE